MHKLTEEGHSASAIRLAVFSGHYRQDRDFSYEALDQAEHRLKSWHTILSQTDEQSRVEQTIQDLRQALADDLDTPTAIQIIDAAKGDYNGLLRQAIEGLLGVKVGSNDE